MNAPDTKVLERALQRERARRETAERLLEDKSRDLYHSYEALQESHTKLADALEEIKSQQIQLVQSEKLASLGTMAAGVAHEINNPLSFVLSNVISLSHSMAAFIQYHELVKSVASTLQASKSTELQHLQKFIVDSDLEFLIEDSDEMIKETKTGINRVKEIVSGLQDFARTDACELEDVNIAECIDSTIKLSHNQIKYNLEVTKDIPDLPCIKGYPGKLSQVFLNLIVNASQAMTSPGTLHISARYENNHVTLVFEDNGCGMPPETEKNIFEPFFTTKPVGKGTGLGLSISHGIVEEHQGKITVQSSQDVGTRFTIVLPICTEVKKAA